MNRLVFALLTLLLISEKSNCQNCVFDNEIHDFGNISVKEKYVFHQFRFVNKGTKPLIIKSVNARCSCIDAVFSKYPIAPQDSGYVEVRYYINSTGVFNKRVKITTNEENAYLSVKGNCYRDKKR